MTDLLIYETGGGGDLLQRGNDLVSVNGYENSTYLSMFGGGSWWGNFLTPNKFLSKTERVLLVTPLTSAGRITIENAVNDDIDFLKKIPDTKYTSLVTIGGPDRLEILITINGKQFNYLWNPDKMFLTYVV
jgi:hypothetical protein